jgi:hypothetical protein
MVMTRMMVNNNTTIRRDEEEREIEKREKGERRDGERKEKLCNSYLFNALSPSLLFFYRSLSLFFLSLFLHVACALLLLFLLA